MIRSRSTSTIATKNGSHEFTIKGYNLAKGIGAGKFLTSDTFTAGGHEWAIYFYPDGKTDEDRSSYVSVFVALAGEGTDVRALFELTLLDQSGSGNHKVQSHFNRVMENGPYTIKSQGCMWGYKRFFRRTALESSDYLKNDCLTLHCTVGVVTRIQGCKLPSSDMANNFKYLLDSQVGWDVAFQVENETFRAHKLILAARSPVFKEQFFGADSNPHNTEMVKLEDIEPSIFEAMLDFIYSDSLPYSHEMSGSTSACAHTSMTQLFLAAADRFGLDRLKQLCEVKLSEEISADTVVTTLCLAEKYQCLRLKAVCLKFAMENLGVVRQSEGYSRLESCPSLLAELLETFVPANEKQCLTTKQKRSSSILGLDMVSDGAATESVNPNSRRVRRRM